MRQPFEPRPQPRRWRWALPTLLVTLGVMVGVSLYTLYRVATFTDSVFAGSQPPRQFATPAVEATPAPEEAPEEAPLAPPTPVPVPVLGTPVPRPPTTAMPPATATPIDERTIVGKLRAGRRTTFLLIGYGGLGHDGPYLTDALVVASYDPRASALVMFNLPRDLWVQTPASAPGGRPGPYRKINEVFGIGLGQPVLAGRPPTPEDVDRAAWLTASVAQQVLGLAIDGWVAGDFLAVRRVVDGLGGVVVDVERAFDDYEYPRHDNPRIDPGVIHVHFNAGPQRLSGERALQYARSRHALQDGGDFGRSRRQQRLLLALKDQVLTPAALPKAFALMDAVQGHLRTSLALEEARDLLLYGRDHGANVRPLPVIIDTTTLLIDDMTGGGASILIPKAGLGNYTAIQRYVQTSLRQAADALPTRSR